MMLRSRLPAIDDQPAPSAKAYEHITDDAVAIVRWLNANRVDFVLVGAVARAVRGDRTGRGPVAIAPAPYGRNLDRLARALGSARARLRLAGELSGPVDPATNQTAPVRLSADRLVGAERWPLRLGHHDLDVEGRPAGVPRYPELLYEASKFTLAEAVVCEVAAPEDIEHYDHLRRTGMPPEIRVTRAVRVQA